MAHIGLYAPNRLSARALPLGELTSLPRPPSWFMVGPAEREEGMGGVKEGGEGRDGKGGEAVPECPNPELASLNPTRTRTRLARTRTRINITGNSDDKDRDQAYKDQDKDKD